MSLGKLLYTHFIYLLFHLDEKPIYTRPHPSLNPLQLIDHIKTWSVTLVVLAASFNVAMD